MRFTFTKAFPETLPNLKIYKDENDNLATLNIGTTIANAYFTCGDLVLNYSKESGEVISVDGYVPYFETLPIGENLTLPGQAVAARLYVADLTGDPIFAIDELPLEVSKNKDILHAGKGSSVQLIAMSENVYIGLTNGEISDIYLYLEQVDSQKVLNTEYTAQRERINNTISNKSKFPC